MKAPSVITLKTGVRFLKVYDVKLAYDFTLLIVKINTDDFLKTILVLDGVK